MHRGFYYYYLLLLTTLVASSKIVYKFQLLHDHFRILVEGDPNIESVKFDVNININFRQNEMPQYSCMAKVTRGGTWYCEFKVHLQYQDVVFTYMTIKTSRVTSTIFVEPYYVEDFRRDEENYTTPDPYPVGGFRRAEENYRSDNFWASNNFDNATSARTDQLGLSTSDPVSNQRCDSTLTVLRNGGNICRNQLIFQDNFDEFNNEYWTNEIRFAGTRLESEFVIYNGSVNVNNGILKISASLSDHGINEALDLGERCTANSINECLFERKLHHYLPPVISGRINSAKYFNFKYGRIEVRAKVPKGDWLIPLITLQPTSDVYGSAPFANGEMRVAFVRGNVDLKWNNNDIGGTRLFGGPIFSLVAEDRNQFLSNITLAQANGGSGDGIDKHFGDKFHIYSLTWKPTELLLSIDGLEYGKIAINFKDSLNMPSWWNKSPNVPFDQMFYITLGLAAGGHTDFPDNVQNKPWENTDPKAIKEFFKQRNNWQATWIQPSLEIDYVRVYAI